MGSDAIWSTSAAQTPDLDPRSPHLEDSAIKINIIPRKGQWFTPPQAHSNPTANSARSRWALAAARNVAASSGDHGRTSS
jgi:hypothetical protein